MRRCFACAQVLLVVLGLAGGSQGCTTKHGQGADSNNYFTVEAVHLQVPKLPDWNPDTTVPPFDNAKGGSALRLILSSTVPGSPRIDVVVDPPSEHPAVLEEFLTRNLQEMGALESHGQIRINHVEQRRVSIGNRPAYRVRHEFTMGSGGGQVAINQVSTFVVLENRGVAITAIGRTELFHPQGDAIERIMAGLKTEKDSAPSIDAVDLGKLGGHKPK